ncbi:MAG TPA: acylphosphatase [Holophaga sp.]|nr:acylphosphatase [Holophaga sp.]
MRAVFQVHGRVQGVGFRVFAQDSARALGLGGRVTNEWGGTVSGEAEGPPEVLEAFRQRLSEGPPWARVTQVDWNPADGGESLPFPFRIHP